MLRNCLLLIGLALLLVGLAVYRPKSLKQRSEAMDPKPWMEEQVGCDLSHFKGKKISLRQMRSYFSDKSPLVEVQIKKNKVRAFIPPEIKNDWICYRFNVVHTALKELAKSYPLPDVSFFIYLWDSSEAHSNFPLFVFAKNRQFTGQIMVPDFSNLASQYQVLPGIDWEILENSWDDRHAKLAWRGSTSQGIYLNRENYRTISRVTLCELSRNYPLLIDSGFTLFFQGADLVPELEIYRKEHLSYEQLAKNKYQMWIDGNSSSYSDSGWRFFSNSVVLKPESENIQWYYQALEKDKHYISVQPNLSDLIEKIEYLQSHDAYAREIAKNGRDFALAHLTRKESLRYLYHLIWEYSGLAFVR